jgi:hypothetical protein
MVLLTELLQLVAGLVQTLRQRDEALDVAPTDGDPRFSEHVDRV